MFLTGLGALARFGVEFVASPRHADVLLVTGPVTTNMREALERTARWYRRQHEVGEIGSCADIDRYIAEPLRLVDGRAIAPDRPGHGITFDWKGLEPLRA